jgi:NADH-quinone oxidoreductase subunit L
MSSIGAMALAGLPPLAGFWSKDTVLAVISDATHGPSGIIYRLIFPVAIIASFLTALYSCRAYLATFHGNETIPPEAGHHPHEAHPTMLAVMGLLALGSISAGFALGWPHAVERFLGQMPIFESEHPHAEPWSIMILSTIISLTGIGTAFATGSLLPMAPQPSSLWFQAQNMGLRRLFIDEVYGRFIVGPVKAIAGALSIFDSQIVDGLARLIATMPAMLGHIGRRLQTGMIASYAFMMLAGIVVVLYWISNGTR